MLVAVASAPAFVLHHREREVGDNPLGVVHRVGRALARATHQVPLQHYGMFSSQPEVS